MNFPDLQKAPKSNLLKYDWATINDLKNYKNVEIKEADKGGSVVILSKSHCKCMILSQFNDEKMKRPTTKISSNPDHVTMKN